MEILPFSCRGESGLPISLRCSRKSRRSSSNPSPSKLTVDFSQVEYFDSSGALFLVQLEDEAAARSVPFTIINVSAQQKQILSLVDREALRAPSLAPRERSLNLVEQLGNATMDILRDVYEVILILGRACL